MKDVDNLLRSPVRWASESPAAVKPDVHDNPDAGLSKSDSHSVQLSLSDLMVPVRLFEAAGISLPSFPAPPRGPPPAGARAAGLAAVKAATGGALHASATHAPPALPEGEIAALLQVRAQGGAGAVREANPTL